MVMQTFPYEIDYYQTVDGVKPFKEWLEVLRDVNGRAKIRIRLDRARQGNLGDHKHLEKGVWELRIDYGPGYRVYFGKDGIRLILLLIGGDKSTQRGDILTAAAYLQDHEARKDP
jgi:putative addiction module killer protein